MRSLPRSRDLRRLSGLEKEVEMEQLNTGEYRSVACLKIGMGEREHYIPINKIENVRINPELVSVPEAPEGIIGIALGNGGPVPYIALDERQSGGDRADWKCGVEIRNTDDQILGILCTRVEEDVEVAPEVLKEQEALWGEWSVDQA